MSMIDPAVRRALGKAALKLAAAGPWRAVTVFDLAQAMGVSPADLTGLAPSDALDAAEDHFDFATAAGLSSVDEKAIVRDRLFDIAMRRFEAMEADRAGLLALERALAGEPVGQAALLARTGRSARWVMTLAGLDVGGAGGAARVQGLAYVLVQARAAWRLDDGGDFAKTMAALDRHLRQGEEWLQRFGMAPAGPKPDPAGA
jgi:ubiquinone biosynthesis protein COQ9